MQKPKCLFCKMQAKETIITEGEVEDATYKLQYSGGAKPRLNLTCTKHVRSVLAQAISNTTFHNSVNVSIIKEN